MGAGGGGGCCCRQQVQQHARMDGSPLLPYGVVEATEGIPGQQRPLHHSRLHHRMNCWLWSVYQKWKCGFEVWEVPLLWCGHRVHLLRQSQYFPGYLC